MTWQRAWWVAMGLTFVTGVAYGARADLVPEEPPAESCPPGSRPTTDHSGPHCEPTSDCQTDADCGDGTCEAVHQCIEERCCTACGGCSCIAEWVHGECDPDRTCEMGTCEPRRICVPPPPP